MARTLLTLRAPLFAAVVLAAASLPAWAQVRAGGRFRANTSYGYQFAPAAAIGPGGPFAVVWVSTVDDASGNGVYGRRFTARGDTAGPEFRVNDFTTSDQAQPSVAFLPDGGMVAVFANGADTSVYARRYDFAGNPRGPEFRVNTAPAATPTVAADPSGGFVVVWQRAGVFGRRFDRAGEPVGGEFQVNTVPILPGPVPRVAVAGSGASMVVWYGGDGSEFGVRAQRYDAAGRAVGQEFGVNSYTSGSQWVPDVAMDHDGNAIVVWESAGQDGDRSGIYGQRYDASGAPRGGEFRVNAVTTDSEYSPRLAADDAGNFVVAWQRLQTPGNSERVYARRFDAQGTPRSGDFTANEFPFFMESYAALASDRNGNFVVTWTEIPGFQIYAQRFGFLFPERLRVDPAPSTTSDGNQILEPCERVPVRTGWRNHSPEPPQVLTGAATSFTGPPGPTYLLRDATADYGTVGWEELGLCATSGDCYEVEIPCPAARPATHWDAELSEKLAPDVQGQVARWRIHVGDSFNDVPRSSPYYLWVEALLHNGVTGGCTATEYCGAGSTTREQMAVFLVAGRAPYYAPPSCQGTPVFADVPITSPYCRWIEELARYGITGGCGGGNYCPTANVSRQEMAVFVLRTAEPGLIPPACATPVFADVPADSPYCRWIEELARRGVVAGCGGGNFCPTTPVTREQMAVFIVLTFGLGIY